MWSNISNPSTTWGGVSDNSSTWGVVPYFLNGNAIGLLLALTYHYSSIPTDSWNGVANPSTTWVNI